MFYWNSEECTEAPPSTLHNIPCNKTCAPGYYLGVLKDNITEPIVSCLQCQENTYSTGSTFRLSSEDMNFNQLPSSAQTFLYYDDPSEVDYISIKGPSFTSNPEGTMLTTNLLFVKPNTWNILEFKMVLDSALPGVISFTYMKESRRFDNKISGKFEFEINGEVIFTDNGLKPAKWTNFSYEIPAGRNEFCWLYSFESKTEYSYLDLSASLSVFL